jgi:hypothetical protein
MPVIGTQSANDRMQGRGTRASASANPDAAVERCRTCGKPGHSSSRSKLCELHTKSTEELLEEAVGKSFERFTRKCTFDSVVKIQYRQALHAAVVQLSEFLRSVVIRSHLLANAYLLEQQGDIPPAFFSQNCFYSIMQIVLNRRVTTTNRLFPVNALRNVWASLTERHPSLNSPPPTTLRRTSDVLADACITLAASYSNHIVLNFEQRVKNYLKHKISTSFPVKIYLIATFQRMLLTVPS